MLPITKIWKWVRSWFKKPIPELPPAVTEKVEWVQPSLLRQGIIVEYVSDMPDHISPHTVYIVGENNFYWMAVLLCPCGCGDLIHLNLLKDAHPRWKFKIFKGLISISPSVWRTSGCKSHFFIRSGEIVWEEDMADMSKP